jgi:hypothetical protein
MHGKVFCDTEEGSGTLVGDLIVLKPSRSLDRLETLAAPTQTTQSLPRPALHSAAWCLLFIKRNVFRPEGEMFRATN